jgi:hypothetical protein
VCHTSHIPPHGLLAALNLALVDLSHVDSGIQAVICVSVNRLSSYISLPNYKFCLNCCLFTKMPRMILQIFSRFFFCLDKLKYPEDKDLYATLDEHPLGM